MGFVRSRSLRIVLATVGLLAAAGGGAAAVGYWTLVRDLPDLRTVRDYQPPLATRVLDRHARPIGIFYSERRRLTPLDELPRHVIDAFVAGEDSAFFEHSGIDYLSIARAAWVNLRAGGAIKQGGSTITQQMVKGLLLTPERRFRRKIREMILARRIEERFTKQEILYLYLNQIYFGHGAYGIGEAAAAYFGVEPQELSVSQGALLAGLPKAPSRYSPYANPGEAERRRLYVLSRMLEDTFIDRATYEEALADVPALRDANDAKAFEYSAYFVEEVRRMLFDVLGGDTVLNGGLVVETTLDADLQRRAVQALQRGLVELDQRQGFRGPTRRAARDEIDAEIANLAEENGFAEALARFAETSGPAGPDAAGGPAPSAPPASAMADALFEPGQAYLGVVTRVDVDDQVAVVAFAPGVEGRVHLEDVAWARPADPGVRPYAVKSIGRAFEVGDVASFTRIEVGDAKPAGDAPAELRVALEQEPIVQGALLSIDVTTDEVIALVGGSDYEKSQFNRVTQARRQPGSAFKPLIYAAALERGYTPASIVHDRPVVYVDETSGFIWRPRNYGRNFYGPITLREALARSVNNATVHLFRDVGVDYVIEYARRLGIESDLNRDLSLALGSSGLTLLELTRAYAVYPAGGRKVIPTFIRRVTDRDGNVLLSDVVLGERPSAVALDAALALEESAELDGPLAQPGEPPLVAEEPSEPEGSAEPPLPAGYVISPERAYLVTDLLRAVVVDPRGTAWRLRALRRPVAGKTGTTNDQADAWFMGFSPEIMTGVWVGHDESRFLGWGETGSRAAAPIWVDYMRSALAQRPVSDFTPPEPIVFARIDRKTGLLADANSTDTVFQAFLTGTEPTRTASAQRDDSARRRELRLEAF